MKSRINWFLGGVVLVLAMGPLWPPDVLAQHGGRHQGRRQKRLKQFDTDGDGKLSREERGKLREELQAQRDERRQEKLNNYDLDGDGKLSDEERGQAKSDRQAKKQEKREQKRQELLEKYDTDGDGELSDEERETMREEMKDLGYPRRRNARRGSRRHGSVKDGRFNGNEAGEE